MSTQADALLAAAAEEDSELGTAILGTMSLGTDSYSTDEDPYDGEEPHIVIGKDRFITVPERLKRLAVQHDHDVETVTFDCPRYWDEHDMSKMKVYVNYVRADNVPGTYPVDSEITIDEYDSEIMHFNWTISREVTAAKGNIAFLVCIKKVDDVGNEDNHWNSELCRECYISEGLEVLPGIMQEYPDIITYLLTRMDLVEEKTTLESMLGYLDTYFTTDAEINTVLKNYVENYLANDPETQSTITNVVNEYIEQNLTTTDKTLTVDGGIADAKATGDAINSINLNYLPLTGGTMTGDISPYADNKRYLGFPDRAWAGMYASNFLMSKNNVNYGHAQIAEGTTESKGLGVLGLGNRTKEGNEGNAYGAIRLYGTGYGYTEIRPSYNGDTDFGVTLPSIAGRLLCTSDFVVTGTTDKATLTINLD